MNIYGLQYVATYSTSSEGLTTDLDTLAAEIVLHLQLLAIVHAHSPHNDEAAP